MPRTLIPNALIEDMSATQFSSTISLLSYNENILECCQYTSHSDSEMLCTYNPQDSVIFGFTINYCSKDSPYFYTQQQDTAVPYKDAIYRVAHHKNISIIDSSFITYFNNELKRSKNEKFFIESFDLYKDSVVFSIVQANDLSREKIEMDLISFSINKNRKIYDTDYLDSLLINYAYDALQKDSCMGLTADFFIKLNSEMKVFKKLKFYDYAIYFKIIGSVYYTNPFTKGIQYETYSGAVRILPLYDLRNIPHDLCSQLKSYELRSFIFTDSYVNIFDRPEYKLQN